MSYIGKAVVVQHRVATGHARMTNSGKGTREHVPVPTELQIHDAIVLAESFVDGHEPKLTLLYKKNDSPVTAVELAAEFKTLYDVPHKDSPEAVGETYWLDTISEAQKSYTASVAALAESMSKPSAEDLDAVAEEEKAKEATSGEKAAPRLIKGSKAK